MLAFNVADLVVGLGFMIVVLGMANNVTWRVPILEEASRLVISGTAIAGVRCRFDIRIAPTDDGAMFTILGDFRGQRIKGTLGTAIEKDVSRQLNGALQRLDALAATA